MTFFELEHMLDATQLCLSCHCTHAGCHATVFVLSLHACWMLRNCVCLVIARMLDATQLCLSCHCTGQIGPQSKQCQKMVKNDVFFFRRMVPIRTNSKQNAFVKTRTHGKNGTK